MGRIVRRVIAFACEGERLVGTLDEAAGRTGLLIVSGGNEPRIGAHRGMAMLAGRLASQGIPTFRFDRRGIGDSSGVNNGFSTAKPDLLSALRTFRSHVPKMTRVVGFGNCDAAATLALFGREVGLDRAVLANPWLGEERDDIPPAAAIRARYAERLRSPAEWLRLLRGGVDLKRLAAGLIKLTTKSPPDDTAGRVLDGISGWQSAARIILAEGDATAIAFRSRAAAHRFAVETIHTASHSFAGATAQATLEAALRRAIGDIADQRP